MLLVLPYDYASLLAEEFGRKAVLANEDAFDIVAPYVLITCLI